MWIFDRSESVTEVVVSGVLLFYKNSVNKITRCVFKSLDLIFKIFSSSLFRLSLALSLCLSLSFFLVILARG